MVKFSTVCLWFLSLATTGFRPHGNGGVAYGLPLTKISEFSLAPDGGDPTDPVAVTACNGAPQTGLVYRNSETEPYLAVNPTDPNNMIAGWHVDRWNNGGGQAVGCAYTIDGGATWVETIIPFTTCFGGDDFERGSDPWISFSPDGRAHYQALLFSDSAGENAIGSSYSDDGGKTWSPPVLIGRSKAQDNSLLSPFGDKNTITADPTDSNRVYGVWTQFRGLGWNPYPIYLTRSLDGGETWSKPRAINLNNAQAAAGVKVGFYQGATIVVLRQTGVLVNVFYRILVDYGTNSKESINQIAIQRSFDKGDTWETKDIVVGLSSDDEGPIDPDLNVPVRAGGALPMVAVNKQNDYIYVTWQDASDGPFRSLISHSGDGGDTWSPPISVGQPGVQTFRPKVAVADDGTVGVLFYDDRNDVLDDDTWDVDTYLKKFDADLNEIYEVRVTDASFDMRQMVIAGSRGYFPGDYEGLDVVGNEFVAAFTISNNLNLPVEYPQQVNGVEVDDANRQDIVFARI